MGLFGKKQAALTKGRKLKTGAAIPLADVDVEFVAWAQQAKQPNARGKHNVTVRVQPSGSDIIVMAGDGSVVGRMEPTFAGKYLDEFQWLAQRGEYGVAEVELVGLDGMGKNVLLVNYDQYCRDGGVI